MPLKDPLGLALLQAVRRQLPPPEGPCQASSSGQSHRPSPVSSQPGTATNKTPPKLPANCIAPEQYVAADEIFKVVATIYALRCFFVLAMKGHSQTGAVMHAMLDNSRCSQSSGKAVGTMSNLFRSIICQSRLAYYVETLAA